MEFAFTKNYPDGTRVEPSGARIFQAMGVAKQVLKEEREKGERYTLWQRREGGAWEIVDHRIAFPKADNDLFLK